MPERLKVLLVNYNRIVRAGLTAILAANDYEVVGEAPDHNQLPERVRLLNPDVVLTEILTDKVDGLEIIRAVKAANPSTTVIIVTALENGLYILDAVDAGASGYLLLKDLTPEMLIDTIESARLKGTTVSTEIFRDIVSSLRKSGIMNLALMRGGNVQELTSREAEILALIGNGESNKTIAETLGLQIDTTKKYISSIVSKIGARSRTHAAIMAAQAGLVFKPQVIRAAKNGQATKQVDP
jgi:DNA-binding NarL/FixJ family response regulator